MTVKDEVNSQTEYMKLRYVEFLEFLGRCAHAKYTDDDDLLDHKLEKLLVNVFQVYGLRLKKAKEELVDDNTSDESVTDIADYDEEVSRF